MNCLVCGSPATSFFALAPLRYKNKNSVRVDNFPIRECHECKSLMLESELPLGLLHSQAEPWTDPVNFNKFLKRRTPIFYKLLCVLNNLKLPNRNIIDFGCSFGNFTRMLKDAGYNPVGIEALKETREYALKNNPDIKFYGSLAQLPAITEGYGCIVAIDSLYYADNAYETINYMTERISDGGIIFIRLLNRLTLCKIERFFFGLKKIKHFGSARIHFSRKGLEILFKKFNFREIKYEYWETYKRKRSFFESLFANITGLAAVLTSGNLLLSPSFIVMARLKKE